MNRHVNSISGRLSLRAPQRESLEILDRVCEVVPPHRKYLQADGSAALDAALGVLASEFGGVKNFEREFPSLCFALATGVGKTRLMGAFIAYLHLAHNLNNFFVLAPNLTIYNKLIADFTPGTPKYVFKGIAEFATQTPEVITGENYEQRAGGFAELFAVRINIFNISKINSEVRGGKSPRIKRLSEYIGQSYFDYLAALPDLVLLMDESHRYRAGAGVRAINELQPVLGLELTATPFVEARPAPIPFQNVIYEYSLSQAMEDGFVKEPTVVTRANFQPNAVSAGELEKIKLEDGVRLHENTKVELETYARQNGKPIVKPFMLIIARDTTHAAALMAQYNSEDFLGGRYVGRAIQVDSSQTGAAEEKMIESLLKVESADEPTEVVIHVNMLKEGWDVTNLYTIVPLRAANARTLVEQSIGRGLRLPYGTRTGVAAVDRLSIVAHDKFQEIVEEANREGSILKLKTLVLDAETAAPLQTVVAAPNIEVALGLAPESSKSTPEFGRTFSSAQAFSTPQEQAVAQAAYRAISQFAFQPQLVPNTAALSRPEVQARLVAQVQSTLAPPQLELDGVAQPIDIAQIVAQMTQRVAQSTIDIPRIQLLPKDEVRAGFRAFTADLSNLPRVPPSNDLYAQSLQTGQALILSFRSHTQERRLEDYIVAHLVDCDDISYDDHADLLYDLAGQVVGTLQSHLSEEDARKILGTYGRNIAANLHAQMQAHAYEEATEYEINVSAGFSPLKASAFTHGGDHEIRDVRQAPPQLGQIGRFVFGGFAKCLYPLQKFDSDTERKMALILDRDAQKWFRPARDQFQIFYKLGTHHLQYQPDFIAETGDAIFLIETKRAGEMTAPEVLAKRDAATRWCGLASDYNATIGGKPWKYLLLRHDAIAQNISLSALAAGA